MPVLATQIAGAGGDLDLTFGPTGDGKVITDFNREGVEMSDMALDSQGRILVIGTIPGAGGGDFLIVRYTKEGGLDNSFGVNGIVTEDFPGPAPKSNGGPSNDHGSAIGVQSNGKIVVSGGTLNGEWAFALARYETDGTLDANFGIGGKVVTDYGYQEFLNAMTIQPDDKIVVGGSVVDKPQQFLVMRYLPNGILDPGFGTAGISGTFWENPVLDSKDSVEAIVLQPGGRVIAAGQGGKAYGTNRDNSADFGLAGFTSTGQIDLSFGENGKVTTDFGGGDSATALVLQPDGKIVALGSSCPAFPCPGTRDLSLARYSSNGILDSSFGNGGKVTTDFGREDFGTALAMQEGKIIAAGKSCATINECKPTGDFIVARYLLNGELDPTFGIAGKVAITFKPRSAAIAIVNQPGGKLVVGGTSDERYSITAGIEDADFALVRILPNSADLSISVSDAPDPVEIGKELTYTATVSNLGPDPAEETKVTFPLPSQLVASPARVTTSHGTCDNVSGVVTCDLGSIPTGVVANIVIKVDAPTSALRLSTTAIVSGAILDPNPGPAGNSATVITDVFDPLIPAPKPTVTPEPIVPITAELVAPPVTGGGAVTGSASTSASTGAGALSGPPPPPPAGPGAVTAPLTSPGIEASIGSATSSQPLLGGASSQVPGQADALANSAAMGLSFSETGNPAPSYNMTRRTGENPIAWITFLAGTLLIVYCGALFSSRRFDAFHTAAPSNQPAVALGIAT